MQDLAVRYPRSYELACEGGARPTLTGMVKLLSRIPELEAELKQRLPSGARCLTAWQSYAEQLEMSFAATQEADKVVVEAALEPPPPPPAPTIPTLPTLPPLPDQCAPTLRAEAEERLRAVVEANFKTSRGLIVLENDLMLYEQEDPVGWIRRMREDWSSKIHSQWLDEFENALELWIASKAQ